LRKILECSFNGGIICSRIPVVWSIIVHAEKIKHQCSSAVSLNLDLTLNQSL